MLTETDLFDAIDATWPPFRIVQSEGWLMREGRGGGQRVSAATQCNASADPVIAERYMRSLDQTPLFMIRGSDSDLDKNLAARGYAIVDPVVLLGQPVLQNYAEVPEFCANDQPSTGQRGIWAAGGVGPARIDVMKRVKGKHCFAALTIGNDSLATAFVAIHNGIAMAHAVEVSKEHRRKGHGLCIMQGIQRWAAMNGAQHLVVLTVRTNIAARSLYENMGMSEMGSYHYRKDLSAQ